MWESNCKECFSTVRNLRNVRMFGIGDIGKFKQQIIYLCKVDFKQLRRRTGSFLDSNRSKDTEYFSKIQCLQSHL